MGTRIGRILCGIVGLLVSACALAADVPVPNADFCQKDPARSGRPLAWQLSGGEGRWLDDCRLEVTGKGTEASSNYWRCDGVAFEPAKLYRFEMVARRANGSGGSAVSGPTFANRDQHQLTSDWQTIGHVFRVPDGVESGTLRVGQWNSTGSHQFNSVRVVPVLPVHTAVGSTVLGQGESIRDGRYRFRGTFGHEGSNYHRTLLRTTTGFNSNRWTFGAGNEVVYRFEVPGCQFKDGKIALNVNYHIRGKCVAEVSTDGESWQAVASRSEVGGVDIDLPESLLPAKTIYLRLRAEEDGSFQVDRVEFDAELDGKAPDGTGKTVYAEVDLQYGRLLFEEVLFHDETETPGAKLVARARNTGSSPLHLTTRQRLRFGPGQTVRTVETPGIEVNLPSGGTALVAFDLEAEQPGTHLLELDINNAQDDALLARLRLSFTVPDYYRRDYGEYLTVISDGKGIAPDVWWCNATHKVPRSLPTPLSGPPRGGAARLLAARNEWEACQIIVACGQNFASRPQDITGLTATISPFTQRTPEGVNEIKDVQLLRAHYHFVDHPTDATGVRGYWPDALPPFDKPIHVPAGQNQALWILVHVPEDAKPGGYQATLTLKGDDFSSEVPVTLLVWGFTLPKQNHLKTAFGLSAGNIFRYHGLKTEEDKRKVLDLYMKSFGDHRISPYDPTPLDPIRVKFLPEADPPRAEVDFTAFDAAMERAVEEYGFNNFRLGIQGMGGGTFHARYEPSIEGFGEDTPEYQAMFASQVKQIEAHLREKGWLDMAFVYWFDEPDPKDYEFVANGMKRLEKYAPGLTRMITEQPGDEFDAHVNVWCPVSHNYDHEAAEARRAHDERFWWYVCTGPKAPYCTLFIDHPASELRVWHWQTWQRDIVGTLVWQSNYWTSSAAYPDEPQNPYEDPMGYRSGYSTPKGTKAFWGNGDGRFIYPPLAAATPSSTPVLDPPVTSIRWEMLREGVEDYEYLYMLRELLEEKGEDLPESKRVALEGLLEVPEAITKDMTTFATDPQPIYDRRHAIARAIEELTR